MIRKRVTASEKKQRHEWAVRQIDAGMGLSELTAFTFTAETWGCSRRNARDVVAAAHKDWLDACYGSEEIDQRDLLFQQVGRLERIARKAENAGQFSAAVGAITALIKGAYLLGCRVSEIAVIRWKDIEALDDGGQIHLFGKGSKRRIVRVSPATLGLFQGLGRGSDEEFVFPSPRRDGHLTRQAGHVCRKWGRAAGFHVHPHQLRHSHATHAVQRGVDVFTLQATLGHSSSATTGHYVASNPRDSSSLRLG